MSKTRERERDKCGDGLASPRRMFHIRDHYKDYVITEGEISWQFYIHF